MRKKITEVKKNNKSTSKKMIAYLTALSLGLTGISVSATTITIPKESFQNEEIDTSLELNTVKELYQKQMNYLMNTINELKGFYQNIDTDDVIKTAYPEAYQVTNYDFNCNYISYGTNYRQYIPKNQHDNVDTYIKLIKENNQLMRTLKIKPAGNSKDPDYGVIPANNTPLGFRIKTKGDRKLIDEYSSIIKKPAIIDEALLNILANDLSNVTVDELIKALENTLNSQINFIITTQRNLKEFYETEDTKNIIKSGYAEAYSATYTDLTVQYFNNSVDYSIVRPANVNNQELLKIYIDAVNSNNDLIHSFKIKAEGNGRDPEYGIILDDKTELGFRIKTKEDYALIDKYSDTLGELESIPYYQVKYLEYLVESKSNEVIKTYENK